MTFFDKADKFKHWADVKHRHGAMPLHGIFSCSDPAEVEKEYQEIHAAGIDYVLMDDTNCIGVDDGLVNKAITAWFDYADKQPEADRIKIAIAAGGELNGHADTKGWTAAVNYLYDHFSHRPSYLRVNGKPVFYWYIEKDIEPNWDDRRWVVRKTYHFFRTGDQLKHGGWGYGADDDARPDGLPCASIHPGWDLDVNRVYARVGGDHYCQCWRRAIESHASSILLSDWNGWNEGTALSECSRWLDHYGEPTPTWYMDLTREYVKLFKGKLEEGAYYRVEGNPDVFRYTAGKFVYQNEYPDGKPTVLVPPGYVKGLPPP